MRLLVLLSLLGVALCAPVREENAAEEQPIVKRAVEQLGFGNQQNLPKYKKKSDPSMLPDQHGSVMAEEPQEVEGNGNDDVNGEGSDVVIPGNESGASDKSAASMEEELSSIIKEAEMAKQPSEEEADSSEPGPVASPDTEPSASNGEEETEGGQESNENNEPAEPQDADTPIELPASEDQELQDGISPETNAAIKELMQEHMVNAEPSDDSSQGQIGELGSAPRGEASQEGAVESLNDLDNPEDVYRLYRTYQNLLSRPNYPEYFMDAYNGYQNGRRRRASGTFMSRLRNREIKRSHRIKRDLPFGDEDLYNYFYPDVDPEDTGYYRVPEQEIEAEEPYALFPEEELAEELAEEGLPYEGDEEEEEEEEFGTPILYGGQRGYFVPSKRQEMLSFVPGNKRDFYPYSEEPWTHYNAFIPKKRSYLDSYGDLVRLARALAMQPEGREQYLQGYEWE